MWDPQSGRLVTDLMGGLIGYNCIYSVDFGCTVVGGVHLFLVIPRLIDKRRVLRRGSDKHLCDTSTFPIFMGPFSGRSDLYQVFWVWREHFLCNRRISVTASGTSGKHNCAWGSLGLLFTFLTHLKHT